jgi:phospholipid N-methyltransferase
MRDFFPPDQSTSSSLHNFIQDAWNLSLNFQSAISYASPNLKNQYRGDKFMEASKFRVRAALALLCLFTLALVAAGQAQQTKEFQPEVGQPGKDVVWVPTNQQLVDKMLDMAKTTPQDYVIDLGSGDGRTVITAAKRGARAMGIEYNPDMVELSKRNATKEGVTQRVNFVKADLFESDFSQATVITMFLLPDINLKLRPKILDLKPGTRIVSNTFTMGDWKPDETASITENCSNWCTALLWIVPAKVGGTWRLPQGELKLTQTYQEVSGTLTGGNKTTNITNGKMRGNEISFTAGDAQYTGHLTANEISGTMKSRGTTNNWKATR